MLPVVVATAKVVLAVVCAGSDLGWREAGVQTVDLLSAKGRRTGPVLKQALAAIEAELDSVLAAERIDPQLMEPALLAVQELFAEHGLSVDELAALGLDHGAAAREVLQRGRQLLAGLHLSEQERYLLERATLGCYRTILSQPGLLPGREDAFQRRVLADLTELKALGGEVADQVIVAITGLLPQASPAPPVEWPVLVGLPPSLADQYQPRPGLRRVLDEAAPGETLVLTQEQAGPGGVGKTQLAAGYARDRLDAGALDVLVWAAATTRDAVLSAYASALGKVRPGRAGSGDLAADAQSWLGWLARTDKRWLVVLDDLADPRQLAGLWPAGPTGRVLVTTRRQDQVLSERGRQRVPVGLFTMAESLAYLTGKLKTHQLVEAVELAGDLHHIPLALAQAASVIADNDLTCADYRQWLADQHNRLVALFPPDALADDYTRTVANTWLASVEAADRLQPQGLASRLLTLAALLDSNGIPAELFTAQASAEYLKAECAENGSLTRADIQTGLHNLRRVSLAETTPAGPDGADATVRVHALVQRASRETAHPDQLAAQVCAAALLQIWPERDYLPSLALRTAILRANAASLYEHAGAPLWQPDHNQLLFRHGRSLQEGGLPTLAVEYWLAAHDQLVAVLGEQHPDTLASRNNLASAYRGAGRLGEAIPLFVQTLSDRVAVLGERHPETLASRNNLALAYQAAGRVIEAIPLLEQTLTDCVAVLGEQHPNTLASRNNLALAYQAAGRVIEVISLLEQTLTDRVAVLGEQHPNTLASRNNVALAYREAGRLTEAISLLERALTDCVAVLGEQHPDTMTSRNNVALAYQAAGRLTEAIPLYEQTLTDSVAVLGERHPDTLISRNNLAAAYRAAGRLTEAIPLYEQTLTESVAVLGERHPDALRSRNNLAAAYLGVGRLTEAIPLYEQTLTESVAVLGQCHPDTLRSRNNLACAYHAAGRPTESIPLFEQTLTDRVAVLGERHPDTLTSRNNLAAAYQAAGRSDEAEALLR